MIIACPKCKSRYQLKDGASPEKVRCKKCQEVLDVKSCVVSDAGASAKTIVPTPPPAAASAQAQPKTAVSAPTPRPVDKSAAKTVVPPSATKPASATPPPRAQAKTVVGIPAGATPRPAATGAPQVASPRAEMKTIAPQARAEMKTVPPPPRAEMKTVAPQPSAEMKTIAGPAAPASAAAPDDLVGKTLGGYEILRKLGQGGMGAVYEARQVALDRSVALKVLPAELAANKSFIVRFTREALAVAKLNHNNIIQIYDVGKADGTYFFSMEFVRGATLQKLVEKEGKLDPATAVGYIMQAARGLEYAHRKNIIHRDIKPDNIMVNEEGVAKVADLGLAKDVKEEEASVTMSGVGMGTPHYMAPEQATDAKRCDQRADIYSLGCTLYHLVTGRVPYDGSSAFEIITKHVKEPITLPHVVCADVPESLSAIVGRMMSKTKEERYNSMAEVVTALEEYLGVNYASRGFQPTEDQIATLGREAEQVAAARKNAKGKMAMAGLGLLVVIVGLIAVLSGSWRFALAVAEFALFAPAAYFGLSGFRRKSYAYRRARNFIFAMRILDWVTVVVVAVVAVAVGIMFNLLLGALVAALLAGAAAVGYYAAFTRPMRAAAEPALEGLQKFVRDLRRKGIPEEDIHLFICQHGGAQGEAICEDLFSYEAAVATRLKRDPQEMEKRSFSSKMRDKFIHFLNQAELKRGRGKAVTGTETHAAEEYLAQLDSKPGILSSVLLDGPRFLIGPSGRVTVGAIMLLLAAVSWKGFMFKDSAALTSLNYGLFSLGILLSGFTRSKIFLLGIAACCIVTGPLAIFASGEGTFLGQPVSKLVESYPFLGQVLESIKQELGEKFVNGIKPPFIVGSIALLAGFVAQFFMDW